MSKTWADDLTLFQALDVVGKVQNAANRQQYGEMGRLLRVPEDWNGTTDELTNMLDVRFAALVNRITNGANDGKV